MPPEGRDLDADHSEGTARGGFADRKTHPRADGDVEPLPDGGKLCELKPKNGKYPIL